MSGVRAPVELPLRLSDPSTAITHPAWVQYFQQLADVAAPTTPVEGTSSDQINQLKSQIIDLQLILNTVVTQVQVVLSATLPAPPADGQIYVVRNGQYVVLNIS